MVQCQPVGSGDEQETACVVAAQQIQRDRERSVLPAGSSGQSAQSGGHSCCAQCFHHSNISASLEAAFLPVSQISHASGSCFRSVQPTSSHHASKASHKVRAAGALTGLRGDGQVAANGTRASGVLSPIGVA
jgi:hypothetical protein